MQLAGELRPCLLCWVQFGIYFFLASFSLSLLVFPTPAWFKWLIPIFLLGGVAVASYHCAIYFGWIESKCELTVLGSASLIDAILNTQRSFCADKSLLIFQIPAPVINFVVYLSMETYCIAGLLAGKPAIFLFRN